MGWLKNIREAPHYTQAGEVIGEVLCETWIETGAMPLTKEQLKSYMHEQVGVDTWEKEQAFVEGLRRSFARYQWTTDEQEEHA